ncbi:nicotinate-nucleotide adenylyltransferase [Shewanella gelidii]|uniref:Probable nicotinate-nucleotide adenylyltransferase n=1 Tax=Shewanella gelidii TaxID=1642821 RepID=A0A917N7I5_9GAMM|nr:nicotinate-nucleotide adenylyltransferase [Shewanella gelidii]MCL1097059.1 nicotinate-nucleotide adenylyltransferase [Shewanella gelidii]GGI72228.1 putative nicotinate-nucleotide adenylyltransferase [Shewanella gelidii]
MRIGILGGTFDPIHFGHIRPAQEVMQQLSLDEVWLMPNHIPPHKTTTRVSTKHRLAMVQQLCNTISGFTLCDIEANRDKPSYTSITLAQLSALYPEHQFFFIMGMDSFVSLPHWHQWQQIVELSNIVVCQREGWELQTSAQIYPTLKARQVKLGRQIPQVGAIIPVEITPQPFSSTDVRQSLSQGHIPENAVPSCVLEYILKHQLYR